jgi:ABC-2 type transport system ATP-binding protein
VIGLLGPNGCGKSTTLNMVLGFLDPSAGTIAINGHDLRRDRVRALAEAGGLVEGSAFYPYLSGRKNLQLLARIRGLPQSRVDEVLTLVDMQRPGNRNFGNYSQGMRQRLGVAAALIHDPQLIVLDEPTSGLDPAGTREMRTLIPAIAAEGHTVVLTSHLLHEVEQVCERVAIMKDGRIIARGTVADLLRRDGQHRIRVADPERDDARRVLHATPGVERVNTEDDGALLVEGAASGDSLNRALVAAGIYASTIERATINLESVFMELTEAPDNEPQGVT